MSSSWRQIGPATRAAAVLSVLAAGGIAAPAAAQVPFQRTDIDQIAGDVKLVGDIDGDGLPDLLIGGSPGENLNWYRAPSWAKTRIATPTTEFTTDGRLGDIDNDGDLDIVVPDGPSGNNLKVFINPRPSGNPSQTSAWIRRDIGSIGDWGKDVYLSDFDGDGRLDIATRSAAQAMIFFQTAPNTWTKRTFSGLPLGNEGLYMGDVDGDGDGDLVVRGAWVRNPGGAAAQTTTNWSVFTIGAADTDFRAFVADINGDGVNDILFSSSENTANVNWWTPQNGNPTGSWVSHTIAPSVAGAHTLIAADMDNDGRLDVVVGQLHHTAAKELAIYFNVNGSALTWQRQVVDNVGIHLGVVADIGADGDLDIFGANYTGNPPVHLWESQLGCAPPVLPQQPVSATVPAGQTATFTVADPGSGGGIAYRWRRNGVPLNDGPSAGGGTISGATTATLTIQSVGLGDAGSFSVVVTNSCGSTTSNSASLTVGCAADWNHDNAITPADVAVFVNDWFASLTNGTLAGDFDGNGVITPADVAVYVNAWSAALGGSC